MSEIHLQVVAGLANRLRALVSGICLAEDYEVPLIIHWSTDHTCAAHFESLFDLKSLPSFVSVTSLPLLHASSCLSMEDMAHLTKEWNHQGPLFLTSYGRFHRTDMPRWIKHLRAIRPTITLSEEIESRLPPFDQSRFLGVHIRRGDNIKAIAGSPYSAFLKQMEKEDSFFVVATDEEEIRMDLKARYPGRVWFPAKVRNRHTEEGIQDAIIDFFCLTRCRRILGSAHSSFTEMAALYGGSELVLA